MNRWYVLQLLYILIFSVSGNSQPLQIDDFEKSISILDEDFRSPVDRPIILAGNFAELRSSHFHMGIDIKPQAPNGKDSIRSIGQGFVSRIKIQPGGYGQSIYIDHPNGYTSVYAHLDEFRNDVKKFVLEWQENLNTYSVDLYPDPEIFKVKKGEFIGMMGNTGHSYAKHLHFEIRETESEVPVNPALFGINAKDTRPPTVQAIDIQRLSPEFRTEGHQTYQPLKKGNNSYTIGSGTITFPAWRAGILVQAFDQLDGAPNRNGVYDKKMYVDDTLYFHSVMNRISFDETKYINSFVYYPEKYHRKRNVSRLYKVPGNPLGIYQTLNGDGSIALYKDIPRKVRIELSDISGNTTIIQFSLLRDGKMGPAEVHTHDHVIPHSGSFQLHWEGATIDIPENGFDRDHFISLSSKTLNNGKKAFEIGKPYHILFKRAKISLPLDGIEKENQSKAIIVYHDGNREISLGGKVEDDQIVTYFNHLGTFYVGIDDKAPTIRPRGIKERYRPGDHLHFSINDNYTVSGMAEDVDYQVFFDEKPLISPLKAMSGILTVTLPDKITPGNHSLRIVVTDDRSNRNQYTYTIKI